MSTLLFLPTAACLFWIVLNFFISRRTSTFGTLTILSVMLMMYFTADAIYSTPGRNTDVVVYTHLMSILSGPSILPLLWIYFSRLSQRRHLRPIHYAWLLLPIALFFATLSLTTYMGTQSVSAFLGRLYTEGTDMATEYKGKMEWDYFLWASLGYRIAMGVELLVFTGIALAFLKKNKIRLSNVWRYFRNGESVRVEELQLFTMILAGIYILSKMLFYKDIFDARPWVAIAQAFLVTTWYFLFMLTGLYGEKKMITRIQAKHVMLFNYNPAIKGPIIEIMMEELLEEAEQDALLRFREKIGEILHSETLTHAEISAADISAVKEKMYSSAAGSWDDSLPTRFRNLMVNEKLFLQPSLSLDDIAERLHTNKTYVSKLVNNTYNLTFPELLNALRIDYAQKYLIDHPDANQSTIAKACGFRSASSFNNIFKKITGLTPKLWLMTR